MHAVAKKSVAVASAVGLAGVSSLFFGAAPASAIPTCENGGTLIADNICELTISYTDGSPQTFVATADMSQLQVLLVAGGGEGGYSGGAGGGGQVKIVDFDGGSAPTLSVIVGNENNSSSVTVGTKTVTALPGTSASNATTSTSHGKTVTTAGKSGVSGNGHKGYSSSKGGGGGGANGSPTHRRDGGAGKVANKLTVKTITAKTITPVFKLFAGDTNCYGGGGAIGDGVTDGTPGCNAGFVAAGGTLNDPVAGFGGGSGTVIMPSASYIGNKAAPGVVVIRWNATVPVTLSFNDGKRGHNPKTEHLLAGDTPTKPSNPKVSGYSFLGWYTDSSFTTAADFTQPVTDFETFYGKFKKK